MTRSRVVVVASVAAALLGSVASGEGRKFEVDATLENSPAVLFDAVALPDGTKGQEIVANSEQITRTDNLYKGYNVTTLQLGSLPWSINYAVLDNVFVGSTDLNSLHAMIDRKTDSSAPKLMTTESFNGSVSPVISTADEVFQIKLGALSEILGITQDQNIKPYVEPFTALTMTKNFFDDGISSIYLIDVL